MKYIFTFIILFLTSACGQLVKSDITVYHALPPQVSLKYKIASLPEQENSLEHQHYVNIVKQHLNALGFIENETDASVLVAILYGMDNGRIRTSHIPIYGQTGVSSSTTVGSMQTVGNLGMYTGTTTYNPTYGITGSQVISSTEFTTTLRLLLIDKKAISENKFIRIYDGKAISSGSYDNVSIVLPVMIESLFEDFPGKSGDSWSSRRAVK